MATLEKREHLVARMSECGPAPSMRPFEIGEVKGVLVRLADGWYATSDVCPHAKAPLHEGALCGKRLVCPWHQSVFDVTTGALLEPPALDGLDRYEVRLEGDEIYVASPDAPVMADPGRRSEDRRTVLIVGAGAAGQVAAEALRREGFGGRVVLIGSEPGPPYDRTNLTKHFLSGKAQREDLPLRREPEFWDRINVERKTATVTRLDGAAKTVTCDDGEVFAYDAAIVATGGIPKPLDVPGSDSHRVCLLRTTEDVERVLALLPERGGRAVVIGASFIGMEAASSLTQRGIDITVLSQAEIPFERQMGREVGSSIRSLHERNGVHFLPGSKVAQIEETGHGLNVHLVDGRVVRVDVAIVGVGVRPATDFVRGVERDHDGGIVVDAHLHAGDGLYAVGDIASFPSPVGERVRIEHWRVAQQHAALAARNIARPAEALDLAGSGFVPFFWTYHFEQRMNYVGFTQDWDEIIFDGNPVEPPFLAYYMVRGKAVAAVGTHRDADLAAMHELLRLNLAPRSAELRAGDYSPVRAAAAV